MPIPPDSLRTPKTIRATLDDTVQQVRDRLLAPDIENKWQAYVLVQSADGRYAAASVFDIQPLIWQQGPPALKRTLGELGLFQLHVGIEQDSIDLKEAQQLAAQHGGYLVVLRGGQVAGFVEQRRSRSGTPIKPTDAFDLFDQPLSPSMPPQTEIVPATLNTTVAKVALDLQAKQAPESAYIVVEMDDGSFRVMSADDLDRQVRSLGAAAWSLPLRQFEARLRKAASRERALLGQEQAETIAKAQGFLVITDGGKPVDLLSKQIVLREVQFRPIEYDQSASAAYSIYSARQDFLRGFDAEAKPERKPRSVNLWFADSSGKKVPDQEPLRLDQSHRLKLNIGQRSLESIIRGEQPPIVEPPRETEEGTVLYVSLFADEADFEIPQPTQAFLLPPWGTSPTIEFEVTPRRQTFSPDDRATVDINVYYRCNLVQSWQVRVEVMPAGLRPQSATPQEAVLLAARTEDYMTLEGLGPRHLTLTIDKARDGAYRFDFLVAADEQADEIQLSCRVNLSREELTHLITKARRQLYNVVQVYELIQQKDRQAYIKSIRALAQVGRQLHRKLFATKEARAVADWLSKHLPAGSTIQILNRTRDFVFPWSLVYEASPWHDGQLAVEHFWGWRYQLAISTTDLVNTYRAAGEQIRAPEDVQIMVGLYARLKGAQEQYNYFKQLSSQPDGRVKPEIKDNRTGALDALQAGNQHLVYFFCHGYTEKMANDIQLDDDLVREFTQMAADKMQQGDRVAREHLEDMFDVSDSWMRLTRGKLLLAMLEEEMEGLTFARHPLVFLNMCQSAQVLPSLSGGLIPFFIEKGARAVIGTECSMNMIFGDRFARAFLDRFLEGRRVAETLWQLRQEFLAEGDPLALAYTLFGDADLRLVEESTDTREGGHMSQDEGLREAVDNLMEDDLDGLYQTLATRAYAAEQGEAIDKLEDYNVSEYELPPLPYEEEGGPEFTALVKAIGEKWWLKLEPKLYNLLCDKSNPEHDDLMDALGKAPKELAILLAPALVASVAGAVPAVVVVIATIAAKKVAEAGLEAMCEIWAEAQAEAAQAEEAEAAEAAAAAEDAGEATTEG